MMTTSEPLLLRTGVKKEEIDVQHHHHHHHQQQQQLQHHSHFCSMDDECSPADSSLYSPTTTALQLEQGPNGGVAAEEADASAISPLSSAGLCRSISQSYSSPEPDDGGLVVNLNGSASGGDVSAGIGVIASASSGMGALGGGGGKGSGGSSGQQSDTDAKQQYHCSSTTANVPGEFSNRHRSQSEFKDEDAPKRLCLVCGDVASGFHYGVASCEACKAFFKRTIQGNIEYTCPAANDCEINKRRRKACQACRFQKCIRMGMLKEGVRLDRVRGGRQKYRRVTPYSNNGGGGGGGSGASSTAVTASAASTESTPASNAAGAVSSGTQPAKKISLEDNKILSTLGQCEPEILTTADIMWPEGESTLANLNPSLRMLCTLSELYDRELVAAIGWAKQIPGFLEMSLNDQMRLLQTSWPEVLSLSLAFRSMPMNGANPKLQWSADFCMNEKEARDCGMEELFFQCVQIGQRLEQLSVTREEYYILKALVLINCDVRVESLTQVKKLREQLLSALCDCTSALRQGNVTAGIQQMQQLLLCMPCIRQVDSSLRRFWAHVRSDSHVPMNKLFLEMLESPMR